MLQLPALQVDAGAAHLIMGPSGAGKTTALHAVAGLVDADAGAIHVDGTGIQQLPVAGRDRFRARRVGIVFQSLHLMDALSALENLLLARYLAGLPQDETACTALLDELAVAERRDARPRDLSRGEAQRVAIARALVNEPAVVLADEPTASLDDATCIATLDLLQSRVLERGAALLLATHDARVRARFSAVTELTPCD